MTSQKTTMIKVQVLIPLLALFILTTLPLSASAQSLERYEYQEQHMGTLFRIVLFAETQFQADNSANKAFQRINQLNNIMSDYLPESELNRLSASSGSGKKIKVSKDLYRILRRSKKWSRWSDGHFDVTVGPLSKLWRKAFRQQEFPDSSAILTAQSKVNYKWMKLYPLSRKVKLTHAQMRLDLGGIAKGYAIDAAMKTLKKQGIKYALVDGGGDLLFTDPYPLDSIDRISSADPAWKIQTPEGITIHRSGTAIASSGDAYRFLEHKGQRYAHIINPKTGYGMSDISTIAVKAPNGTTADALASILSIIDPKEMKRWKRKWKVIP